MAANVIHVRATKAQVLAVLRQIPKEAQGTSAAAQAILIRMGLELLARIRDAFITKARGGTDEAGLRWQPLSPATIAYSRRHPGLPPPKVRAAYAPSYALSPEQRKAWWKYYGRYLAIYKGDKGHAAAAAWMQLKAEEYHPGLTLMDRYRSTQVEILRDTGLLLNSLSPGVNISEKVWRLGQGWLILGTNRKWAKSHHEGVPGRIPQRRLWPEVAKWPANWWAGIMDQARGGLIDLTLWMLRRWTA